ASQLQAAKQELAALRLIESRALAQRSTLQSHLSIAPSVEKDYAQLIRNQDLLKDQYSQLQAKVQEADVSRSYENEQQGERFTLIRSATIPGSPEFPNRIGLILIGVVLGAALAIGAAIMAENSDATVRGYHDLGDVTGVQLLASVPVLLNPQSQKRRRRVFL